MKKLLILLLAALAVPALAQTTYTDGPALHLAELPLLTTAGAPGVITTCAPYITGNYVPAPTTAAQRLNNAAIELTGSATLITLGTQAQHDFFLGKQDYAAAAKASFSLHLYNQAITEVNEAIAAGPTDPHQVLKNKISLLMYQVQATASGQLASGDTADVKGDNDVIAFVNALPGVTNPPPPNAALSGELAALLDYAFAPGLVTPATAIAFWNALLARIAVNPGNQAEIDALQDKIYALTPKS